MKHNYLFYDIESTGLNPCFDQVLQFAAIRTDLELNELERYEIRIKLNPDIIPSPKAILVHQQGINQMQNGVSEYEGIKSIHNLLNQPGTISLGYNTLGFDDEFLRFSFYRNLLPPYTHQFANQCSRMDIYPLTVMYYLFAHDTINWPMIDNKLSLRLENLNACNQLASGMAHDAMVDVDATVELAKKLKSNQKMWDFCCGYMQKNTDASRIHQLQNTQTIGDADYPLAYVIHSKIGVKNSFIAPVIGLGPHRTYKNQTLWLRLDNINLAEMDPQDGPDSIFTIKKKMGEEVIILPKHERYDHHISTDRHEQATVNLTWLKNNPEKFARIEKYHQNFTYPKVDNIDADAALYDLPFASRAQQTTMQHFHQAAVAEKPEIAKQLNCPAKLELAQRLLCKHFSTTIPPEDQQDFDSYCAQIYQQHDQPRIKDFRNRFKLDATTALNEIQQLQQEQTLSATDTQLLEDLKQYITAKKIKQPA
jgi:exodeoxyribonuclease I